MVSFWPWRGEDTSPASFEKTLSALATKITKLQTQQDTLHQRHRRYKALWTLYTSFAYLLCFIIAFLVIGWKNISAMEYTALAGAPVSIYLMRNLISTYFLQRLSTLSSRLDDQLSLRARTIEKLKAATKYDSTQTLLERYGGAPSTPKASPGPKPKTLSRPGTGYEVKKQNSQSALGQRTGISPPATANILRPTTERELGMRGEQTASPRSLISPIFAQQGITASPRPSLPGNSPGDINAEFAPNAFPSVPQYADANDKGGRDGHWYDRILDVLLGEDETLPKNRLALVCRQCRLVNGLAPPGARSLGGLGRWRCGGCGGWNGEEKDEGTESLATLKESANTAIKIQGNVEEKEKSTMEEVKDKTRRDIEEETEQVSDVDDVVDPGSEK